LVRGRALGHTPSRAFSCAGTFCNGWLLRDKTMLTTGAEKLFRIVPEERSNWLSEITICSGWLKIEEGGPDDGCRLISEGLAALDALGEEHFHQFFLLLLAHGQLRSDKLDDALDTLDRAEALNRSGHKWCEAEVHRLKGDVLVARSVNDEAERAYRRALELARSSSTALASRLDAEDLRDRHPDLSQMLRGYCWQVRWISRSISGRWRDGALRLSQGARG
jgi:predicted ATPase